MPEVRYVGLPVLEAKARAALQVAVTEAAHDFVGRAQAATPVDTGTLRASIHVTGIASSAASVTARIATGAEANEYAIPIHEGTGPHVIRARNAKALAFDGHFAKSVQHPGTKPYLYMSKPLAEMAPVYRGFIARAAAAEF